jgi:7-cyano-7-deazaguanine synthase
VRGLEVRGPEVRGLAVTPPAAVVLLSGGLDSATCLAIAVRDGFAVHALSVDYGQRHRVELDAARDVAERLHAASHRVVRVDLAALGGSALTGETPVPKGRSDEEIGRGVPVTYVPARNTVFLAVATAAAEAFGADAVYVGVNALDSSGYPDCRPEFLAAFREAARLGTKRGVEGRPVEIRAPLVSESKAGIARLATSLGVPVARTLSCYDPVINEVITSPVLHCGRCDACLLRRRGFREAGLEDPTAYADAR